MHRHVKREINVVERRSDARRDSHSTADVASNARRALSTASAGLRKPTARKNGLSSRVTLVSSSSAVDAICVSWKRSVSSTLHHEVFCGHSEIN